MQRLGIGIGIDRNGADAHGTRSADNPASNFAPVGYEEGLDHGFSTFTKATSRF